MAKAKNDVKEASIVSQATDESGNDIARSGRADTEVATVTEVEDRTEEPDRHLTMRYKAEDVDLGDGTILTNYTEAEDAA